MQFDFSELVSFAKHHKNYDFIVGFRKKRADSPRRIFVSYFYNKIIHSMFQLPLKDVDCAFKFMRKSALSGFEKLPDSFFVSAELMIRSIKKGYRIKEIGVTHLPRKKGVSKVTFRQIHKTVIDLTHLYREI